ncbi:hypothetical protein JCM10135_11180 [Stetteria hydrogenophila]
MVAFRAAVTLAALLASAAASLVLVRRLDPASYAAFQTLTRRVSLVAGFFIGVFGFWAYRYTAQGVEGAVGAGVLVAALAGVIASAAGFAVAGWLGLGLPASLLASAALGAFTAYQGLLNLVNAARPLRHPVLQLFYRVFYSLCVILLVYYLGGGLAGALASVALSASAAAVLAARWLRGRLERLRGGLRGYLALVREWAKGSSASLPSSLARLVNALDVAIAYPLGGGLVVAAYFAVRAPFTLAVEAVAAASVYLTGFLLGGGRVESAVGTLRLTLIPAAFISGYALANAGPVLYLLNPGYSWASRALRLTAAAAYLDVLSKVLLNILGGTVGGRVRESMGELRALGLTALAGTTAYVSLEALLLPLAETPELKATLWALAYLAATLLLNALLLARAPPSLRALLKGNAGAAALYPAVALAASEAFRTSASYPRFWSQLEAMLPGFTASLALYLGILALIDPFTRRAARRILGLRPL